jgi:cytochrome c peroxidase
MLNKINLVLTFVLIFVSQNSVADDSTTDPMLSIFKALPESISDPNNPSSPEKITLGKKLYLDTLFSLDKKISCNSCHRLDNYGVDNEKTSPGHLGVRGDRNSPTSFNAALHISQFWDGRAASLEEQALGPVLNPKEMAMPAEDEVIKRIKAQKEYVQMFAKAFPAEKEPISYKNFGKAIGAFEKTLLTPSRFDKYLKGDKQALSAEEIEGLKTFYNTGCIACHNGVGVGGGSYQKLGAVIPYETKDLGRYNATKNEADKYFFKVPSLRNIEKTAPYFHDGNVATLEEAVTLMGKHQLGKDLAKDEVTSIVTFLKSLTGELVQR